MTADAWTIGPFTPVGEVILTSTDAPWWAAKDIFNPGGIVHDGRIHLLVRGEDTTGRYAGTSRIGLAVSDDGVAFTLDDEPVIAPGDPRWDPWEAAGGCEDPRVVASPDGGYVCYYTGFDGKVGTLMVATSDDLRDWMKHGPAFSDTPWARRSSKSGSVVTEVAAGRLVASRVEGKFRMFWGEGVGYAATSDDLIHWDPVTFDATADRYLSWATGDSGENGDTDGNEGTWNIHRVPGQEVLRPVLFPRPGRFDSLLVEPGPPALRTAEGIVLIYNGANHWEGGDPSVPPLSYQPGQALFDPRDPLSPIARTTEPTIRATTVGASSGQVANVCFAQALVLFDDTWWLYYGMADSEIGCARAPATSRTDHS